MAASPVHTIIILARRPFASCTARYTVRVVEACCGLPVTDMHTFVLNYTKNELVKVILTKLVFAPVILAMLIHNLTLQKQTYFKYYIYIYI